MFKGIAMNLRDAKWHKKHLLKRAKHQARAADRLRSGVFASTLAIQNMQTEKMEKKYREAIEREKGKRYAWYIRLWAFIRRMFGGSKWQYNPA